MMQDAILHGDCLARLRELPAESVQCIVTSPPYFGLRDYGTAQWEGGSPDCDHKQEVKPSSQWLRANVDSFHGSTRAGQLAERTYSEICPKCGATRHDAQIGLEEHPDAYVAKLVEVFREARRVLRRDGVLWLNLGDSYTAGGGYWPDAPSNQAKSLQSGNRGSKKGVKQTYGIGAKQLLGMPWRVAFALQADGWILRSDVIWAKPNCMPESVKDRPTKSHEYMFLFSKQERYFYDADAIREPAVDDEATFYKKLIKTDHKQVREFGTDSWARTKTGFTHATFNPAGRNKRTVWTIATSPYKQAHFATFPPALVEPCVLAGSSPQACEHCGAPWERVTEVDRKVRGVRGSMPSHFRANVQGWPQQSAISTSVATLGWQPTCRCDNTGSARCVVLDPFMGAGTVGMVAKQHGRSYLGIELNAAYITLAEQRIADATKPRAKILKLPKRAVAAQQASLWEVTA